MTIGRRNLGRKLSIYVNNYPVTTKTIMFSYIKPYTSANGVLYYDLYWYIVYIYKVGNNGPEETTYTKQDSINNLSIILAHL